MKCKLCQEADLNSKDNLKHDRKCAFETGTFLTDNWSCETMLRLRDLCSIKNTQWNEKENIATIPIKGTGEFIVMTWYKSSRRTYSAIHIHEERVVALNIEKAMEVIRSYE